MNVVHGDCLTVLRYMAENSVDAVVTDPPYGLEFMGKEWDGADGFRRSLNAADAGRDSVFGRTSKRGPEYRGGSLFQEFLHTVFAECLRVLKPGGHMVSFGGTRTYHRMASAAEDAGFEVRDQILWLYGQGFPKSLNVEKATESAQWSGWGTCLKPAVEPIVLARKPLSEPTVAKNVLKWGVGALNIDGCRITPTGESKEREGEATCNKRYTGAGSTNFAITPGVRGGSPAGRFPANVILSHHPACVETDEVVADPGYAINRFTDGAKPFGGGAGHEYESESVAGGQRKIWLCHPDCPVRMFPSAPGQQGDLLGCNKKRKSPNGCFGEMPPAHDHLARRDTGSAARFFYQAKANKKDRCGSNHPTVKPVALMRYLCRFVCPPGGLVLDPFAGSGTTGEAAVIEGFDCVLIEREAGYYKDILHRMSHVEKEVDL
jgi:site-specific DNA-methyltransferase (adenine-specific)